MELNVFNVKVKWFGIKKIKNVNVPHLKLKIKENANVLVIYMMMEKETV